MVGDAAPRDADQPAEWGSFRRVIRGPVPECALEDLARQILGVRTRTDAIGDVAVNGVDK